MLPTLIRSSTGSSIFEVQLPCMLTTSLVPRLLFCLREGGGKKRAWLLLSAHVRVFQLRQIKSALRAQ